LAFLLILAIAGLQQLPATAAPTPARVTRVAAPAVYPPYAITGETVALYGKLPKTVIRVVKLETFDADRNAWVFDQQQRVPRSGRYAFRASLTQPESLWRVRAPAARGEQRRWPALLSRVTFIDTLGQNGEMHGEAVQRRDGVVVSASFAPHRPGRSVSFSMTTADGVTRLVGTAEQDAAGTAWLRVPPPPYGLATFTASASPANGVPAFTTPEFTIRVVPTHQPDVVAHRGGAGPGYPENTMPAFRRSVELGVDALETDTQLTSDGEWVLMHDVDLRRTTDAATLFPDRESYAVSAFTLAEIRRLTVGGAAGVGVPTLREFLAYVTSASTPAYVESKTLAPEAAKSLVSLIDDFPALVKPTVGDLLEIDSFTPSFGIAMNSEDPDIDLGYLSVGVPPTTSVPWADSLLIDYASWTAEKVASAKSAGKRVVAFTVNPDTILWQMADLDVDAIITDVPAQARLALRGV